MIDMNGQLCIIIREASGVFFNGSCEKNMLFDLKILRQWKGFHVISISTAAHNDISEFERRKQQLLGEDMDVIHLQSVFLPGKVED